MKKYINVRILIFNLLITFLTYSCTEKKVSLHSVNPPTTDSLVQDSLFKLIDDALILGDRKAYNRISAHYFIQDKTEEFLYVAIVMANKFNNSEACYHVYKILNGVKNQERLDNLDERTKSFALFYLLRSYEMGYPQSKYEVELIFKERESIPNSSYYLSVLPQKGKQ